MPINCTFSLRSRVCFLAAVFLFAASLPLCAQQTNRNRKPKISIPPSVLECPYTADDIFNKLTPLNEWVGAWQKASKEDFDTLWKKWAEKVLKRKKGQKSFQLSEIEPYTFVPREKAEKNRKKTNKNKKNQKQSEETQAEPAEIEENEASGTFYKLTKSDLRKNYKSFEVFLRFKRLTDDMQEATRKDESAFRAFDKKVKELEAILEKMDRERRNDGSIKEFKRIFVKEFIPALNAAATAYEELKKAPRILPEKRRQLQENNEKRRKEDYLKKMSKENATQDQKKQENR